MRRPARPAPPPKTPIATRLEHVRTRAGIASLRAFWQRLSGDWEGAPSYEAVRTYHYDRDPPATYLARVADVFGVRVEWLISGREPATEEEARRIEAEQGDRGDPFVRAALDGLLETLPLRSHLTYEYRALGTVALKLGDALRSTETADVEHYRLAGRLLGKCIAAPLDVLGVRPGDVPPYDHRTAQTYISAAAHAVETIAHYAKKGGTDKCRSATPGSS